METETGPRHHRYDITQPGLLSVTYLALSFSCHCTPANLFHRQVTMGDYKIYLGNIPDDCRERDVEKFFKGYGKIRNIVLKVRD